MPEQALTAPRSRRHRFSDPNRVWAMAGIIVLIVVIGVSMTNLQEIYEAQKDFVVGSLLSLVGFCFAKAISASPEDAAIDVVNSSTDPELRAAVIARVAHDEGVLKELSVLARDVEAANARLSQYFDLRTRTLEFHKDAPLLFVAIEDLDQAAERVSDVQALLGGGNGERFAGDLASGGRLTYIRRYLREAANRRDQLYEHLSGKIDWQDQPQLSDTFSVMSADIWKAGRALNRVLGRNVGESPIECLRMVNGYVSAALVRGAVLKSTIADAGLQVPVVFDVLMADLEQAKIGIAGQLERLGEPGASANANGAGADVPSEPKPALAG